MAREAFRVVVFGPLPEGFYRALLSPYAGEVGREIVVRAFSDLSDYGGVIEALREADVVIGDHTMRVRITEEMCREMRRVRLVQQPSTGYDHIDVEGCARHGVPVANIGGANAASVAEYTIMVALALLKRLIEAYEGMRAGRWMQWELMDMGTFDLMGRVWGIIGLGRIGKELARRLRGFDVRILYYDKVRQEEAEAELKVEYRPLIRLLRESDVVSIHVPLTSETRGMIGERELRAMKPTSILINPSRGEVVDEQALARALEERWISGAAVDVYSVEPPPRDHPLLRLKGVNLILTPHIAGANTDSRSRIIQATISNVVRVLKGEKPENVVNM